jgi:hypothetical protein
VKDSKNNSINIIVGLTFEPKLPKILWFQRISSKSKTNYNLVNFSDEF